MECWIWNWFFGKTANFLAKINPVTYIIDSVKWCYFKGLDLSASNWWILSVFTCISLVLCGILFSHWISAKER